MKQIKTKTGKTKKKTKTKGSFFSLILASFLVLLFAGLLLAVFYLLVKPTAVKHLKKTLTTSGFKTSSAIKGNKIKLESSRAALKKKEISSLASPSPFYSGYCINVPVLMYHHIQPEAQAVSLGQTSLTVDNTMFASQMAYLEKQGYTTITTEQLANALLTHQSLPAKSLVITIDDGYSDIYTYAFPVLQQYHLTANLMIVSGLVDNPDLLTWNQIKQMQQSGLIYLNDHTWSHFPLANGTEKKDQFEIQTAQKQIEQETGQTVDILAYPYGSFDTAVVNILVSDGFKAAFSSIPGTLQCDSFIMSLHRTRIGNAPLSEYGF